tara:strand:+ start:242 stop:724 length:483 start_codon:yes stop_codon:yes gene_type:complete
MNAEDLGKKRQDAHPNGTPRYYDDPNVEDTIGVAGEIAFAKKYNLKIDDSIRPEGDGGVDFIVSIKCKDGIWRKYSIDIKVAQKAYNLFVKEHEIERCANILVLGHYKADKTIEFLGWETRSVMKTMPKKVFSSLGIVNYYKHRDDLRPMSKLDEILKNK